METSSKNPNAECQIQRNRIDDAIVMFIEQHKTVSFAHVLQAAELPFDNQQIRASIRRLKRGGRIEVQHWVEKRPARGAYAVTKDEFRNVACQGLALKKAA